MQNKLLDCKLLDTESEMVI